MFYLLVLDFVKCLIKIEYIWYILLIFENIMNLVSIFEVEL